MKEKKFKWQDHALEMTSITVLHIKPSVCIPEQIKTACLTNTPGYSVLFGFETQLCIVRSLSEGKWL